MITLKKILSYNSLTLILLGVPYMSLANSDGLATIKTFTSHLAFLANVYWSCQNSLLTADSERLCPVSDTQTLPSVVCTDVMLYGGSIAKRDKGRGPSQGPSLWAAHTGMCLCLEL